MQSSCIKSLVIGGRQFIMVQWCRVCYNHRSTRRRMCILCGKRRALPSCWPEQCYVWSLQSCRDCANEALHNIFGHVCCYMTKGAAIHRRTGDKHCLLLSPCNSFDIVIIAVCCDGFGRARLAKLLRMASYDVTPQAVSLSAPTEDGIRCACPFQEAVPRALVRTPPIVRSRSLFAW